MYGAQRCGLLLPMFRGLYVCLSVCHNREHYKTAEPIEVPFGLRTRVGPRNHVIVGGSRSPAEGTIFFWGGSIVWRIVKYMEYPAFAKVIR